MKLRSMPLGLLLALALLLAGAGPVASAEKGKSGITIDWGKAQDESQSVDARYTPEGLRQAFAALCQDLGYRARVVEIDQSEFPFLVYGVLEGRCDYQAIRDRLGSMRGYAYSGSVTSIMGEGSVTVFALDMIPRDRAHDDPRRTMDRMMALAKSLR